MTKQKEDYVSSIKKSQKKTNQMLANASGIYEKIRALRPLLHTTHCCQIICQLM